LLRQLYDAEVDLAFAVWKAQGGAQLDRGVHSLREHVRTLRERARNLGVVS
jgi:hypothetical protein